MTLNLAYRIKRLFHGESGIVESVMPIERHDLLRSLQTGVKTLYNYRKDSDKNTPTKVTIRNSLGELVNLTSPMVLERRESFKGRLPLDYQVYKQYKPGDRFP